MLANIVRRSAPASRLISRSFCSATPRFQAPTSASASPTTTQNQEVQQDIPIVNSSTLPVIPQAPNKPGVWSASQTPRSRAMTGPRFEQMNVDDQPQPWAAIDLIHKVPVQWSKENVVSCDGGGGPLGHPRIYINLDKPKVTPCTYCGTPYAHEHNRKFLESLPSTPYPLK